MLNPWSLVELIQSPGQISTTGNACMSVAWNLKYGWSRDCNNLEIEYGGWCGEWPRIDLPHFSPDSLSFLYSFHKSIRPNESPAISVATNLTTHIQCPRVRYPNSMRRRWDWDLGRFRRASGYQWAVPLALTTFTD